MAKYTLTINTSKQNYHFFRQPEVGSMVSTWARRLASTVALGISLAACSVGMAMSGKNNPDLGAVKVGSSRGEVEMQLGSPVNSSTLENGSRIDIYEYEIGNEPSGGRAMGHAVMDVLTLGIWEVAGTPIEGFQGDKYRATIIYNDNDNVAELKTIKVSSNN